jgi:EmrB/QacA subfamily drug resistance transporter
MPPDTDRRDVPADVWSIAFVVVFGAFMAGLDTSLVNVGLANIVSNLHGSLSAAQWITSGYLIALAASLPACGWLTRRFGAPRVWLSALGAFTILSLLCAASTSLTMLIIVRILQGVAGGVLVPSGQTILGRAAGPLRMGTVMNTAGIAVVLAPAIGPAIGGLLIAALSWRWLFLINIPIGVIALVVGFRLLPREDPQPNAWLDVPGLALLVAGLPLVVFGIIATIAQQRTFNPALLALPLGLLCFAAFAIHARRARPDNPPILDLGLFADRRYAAAQVSVLFCGASLYGGLIVLPLYFQLLRGEGIMQTGLLLLSYGAGSALALRPGGILTDRIGGGRTAMIGLIVTIVATLPFVYFNATTNIVVIEALQFIRGIGVSFAGMPLLSSAYAVVSKEKLADATVEANILQRIGGSLGSALFVVGLELHSPIKLDDFHRVFAWLTGTALLALISASWLAAEQKPGMSARVVTSEIPRLRARNT